MERSFNELMSAVRKGDITSVQSCLTLASIDVNAVDEFDYSPLILVSYSFLLLALEGMAFWRQTNNILGSIDTDTLSADIG